MEAGTWLLRGRPEEEREIKNYTIKRRELVYDGSSHRGSD